MPIESLEVPSQEQLVPTAFEEFGRPYKFPYQLGVYIATNAIPDAYAVIDGPDCLFRKAEWVHGKHDLSSTLLDIFGNHRIVSTLVNAEAVIKDRGEMVAQRIRQVHRIADSAVVFVCAMPHVMIIGTQYDKILRNLEPEVHMQLMELPSLSLLGDWIDGYIETLASIAASIDLNGGEPDPNSVAVIGYMMDRTEPDHQANVTELKRMFAGIGLNVSSVWLGNEKYADLANVKNAKTLVTFPYGRKAARIIAQRTGAQIVEVQTPFGAGMTQRMLRAVGRATGRLDQAQAFIDSELRAAVPRLEWVVRHLFLGKRLVFGGSPDMIAGMYEIATAVGMEMPFLVSSGRKEHKCVNLADDFESPPPVYYAPTASLLDRVYDQSADLMIGDSHFANCIGVGNTERLEFGFPSHFDHAIFDRPFLGFRGWLSLLDRMAQSLSRNPIARSSGRRGRQNDGPGNGKPGQMSSNGHNGHTNHNGETSHADELAAALSDDNADPPRPAHLELLRD